MSEVVSPHPPVEDIHDVELGPFVVTVATGFGPRILGLRMGHGPQLFARLDGDVVIERAESGTYHLRGGHRLWAAPEVPAVTYAPDDHRCDLTREEDAVTLTAPADGAGLRKEITVRHRDGSLLVDHRLTNAGTIPLNVGPWAVTQLRLGGVAILPLGAVGTGGVQADRSLVLWPYTDLSDPRLSWRPRAVLVAATAGARLKVGSGPRPGRLGYLLDGHLFTKAVPTAVAGDLPDRGAVGQVYVDDGFCELESLGVIVDLLPGRSVSHREVWVLEACGDLESAYRTVLDGAAA